MAASTVPGVDVCNWLGCKPAAASYSVDDAGIIQGGSGGPISYGDPICRDEMVAAGFRGTYYYIGSENRDWFQTYSDMGFEIGAHTDAHELSCSIIPDCWDNPEGCTIDNLLQTPYTSEQVTAIRETYFEPNIQAIEAGTGKPVISMAWPCGNVDGKRVAAAQNYFVGSRGYYDQWENPLSWVEGINDATPLEIQNIYSIESNIYNQINQAIAQEKWAVITIHDTCYGIDVLANNADQLWLAPVGEVLKYIKVRDAAVLNNYSRMESASGTTIAFDAVHNLPAFQRQAVDGTSFLPIVYDNPVTLKVDLLPTDDVLAVSINGQPASFTIRSIAGTRYLLVDTPLDTSRHVEVSISSEPLTITPTEPSPSPTTATPDPNADGCPCSLWDGSIIPSVPASGDSGSVVVGTRFQVLSAGNITGMRFYKGLENTGTHTGYVFTADQELLGTVVFTNETETGWQTATFENPILVSPGVEYIVAYHAPNGHYAHTTNYFLQDLVNGPIVAYGSTEQTPNGVYSYSYTPGFPFPSLTYDNSNYWVDVIFDTALVTPTPETPEPTTVTPEPTTVTPEPTTVTPEPTTVTPEPTTVTPEPTTVTPEPTTVTPEPTTVTPEPTTVTPEPTTVTPEPTTVTPNPTDTVTPTPKPSGTVLPDDGQVHVYLPLIIREP